jgi:hypothetical protein
MSETPDEFEKLAKLSLSEFVGLSNATKNPLFNNVWKVSIDVGDPDLDGDFMNVMGDTEFEAKQEAFEMLRHFIVNRDQYIVQDANDKNMPPDLLVN